jgi:hypothetical protein
MWVTGCVDCRSRRRRADFAQRVDLRANRVVGPRLGLRGVTFGPLYVGRRSVWFGGYDRSDRTIAFSLDQESEQIDRFLLLGPFLHSGMAFDPHRRTLLVARAPGGVLRADLAGR